MDGRRRGFSTDIGSRVWRTPMRLGSFKTGMGDTLPWDGFSLNPRLLALLHNSWKEGGGFCLMTP